MKKIRVCVSIGKQSVEMEMVNFIILYLRMYFIDIILVERVESKCETASKCLTAFNTQFPTDEELMVLFNSQEVALEQKHWSLARKGRYH